MLLKTVSKQFPNDKRIESCHILVKNKLKNRVCSGFLMKGIAEKKNNIKKYQFVTVVFFFFKIFHHNFS